MQHQNAQTPRAIPSTIIGILAVAAILCVGIVVLVSENTSQTGDKTNAATDLSWFHAPSVALYHHFEGMAMINFPVSADLIKSHLHPSVKLDLDKNGIAWVSLVSAKVTKTTVGGVPVPDKESILQVRTYVTGPDASGNQIRGCYIISLLLSSRVSIVGADVFFQNTIDIAYGNQEVTVTNNEYSVTGSQLEGGKASVHISGTVLETAVEFDPDFFTDRHGWFGQNAQKSLTLSTMVTTYAQTPRQFQVQDLQSSVLSALSLGPSTTQVQTPEVELCKAHPESCFYIGAADVTFKTPVVVATKDTARVKAEWNREMGKSF